MAIAGPLQVTLITVVDEAKIPSIILSIALTLSVWVAEVLQATYLVLGQDNKPEVLHTQWRMETTVKHHKPFSIRRIDSVG